MNDRRGEYLHDRFVFFTVIMSSNSSKRGSVRVHCRIYRSTNINAD
jgi:hypothetical protein